MKFTLLRALVVLCTGVSSAYSVNPQILLQSQPLNVELSSNFHNPTPVGQTDTITYKITNNLPYAMRKSLLIKNITTPRDVFTFEDGCSGKTLASHAFCLVSITFQPNTAGTASAQISIGGYSNNEVLLPAMTAIGFMGVRSGVVGTVDIDVPAQATLNTPHAYRYRFVNTTKQVIVNPSVSVQATNGTQSITYTNCNSPISVGASCTVTGQYTPTSPNGSVTATLQYPEGIATTGSGTGGKLIGYLEGWNPGPSPASILAAGYTNVIIGFAVFSLSGPGTLVLATSGIEPGYVQALQSKGIPVSISIGGAGTNIPGTTVNLDDAVQAASSPQAFEDAMVASLNSLIQDQGYSGIDIDIEQGFTVTPPFASLSGNVQILTNILNRFHEANPTANISMAPQTPNVSPVPGYAYNNTFSNYSGLIENTYSIISWVAIQNYNQGSTYGIDCNLYETSNLTTSPDAAVADAIDTLAAWPSQCPGGQASGFNPYTGPLVGSQVAIGFAAPNGSGVSDGSPPAVPSVINRAVECLRTGVIAANSCDTYAYSTPYPTAGSVMYWDINYDAANGFASATGVYNCVVNGNC